VSVGFEQTQGLDKKKRKKSENNKHWEMKHSQIKKTNCYTGGSIFSGSKLEDMLTKLELLLVWHPSPDCIFGRWKVEF